MTKSGGGVVRCASKEVNRRYKITAAEAQYAAFLDRDGPVVAAAREHHKPSLVRWIDGRAIWMVFEISQHMETYAFGRFRLLPNRQLLTCDDAPVRIGSRAFDILTLLVRRAGTLVSKEDLVAHAWPTTFVHESNLKVNIAALRRVLSVAPGEVSISTVPGRGYRFVAPVETGVAIERDRPSSLAADTEWFSPLLSVIGRQGVVEDLTALLSTARLVTFLGTGGVGKTTVAGAVAGHVAAGGRQVRFVDLTGVADPSLVPEAIAAACEVRTTHADPLRGVIGMLGGERMLIVLDNCEHVLHAAAASAESLIAATDGIRILATSRETMRISAEEVYRLGPLACPLQSGEIAAYEALEIPAVQLFVTRAAERAAGHVLTDEDTPAVCAICRQLDGLPLAIELAARRMATFSPEQLLTMLRDSLHVLSYGPQNAPVQQQTLLATLDWSYKLLSRAEATVLRELAAFAGLFTLDCAVAVAASATFRPEDVIAAVEASLVSRITAEYRWGALHYRLFETTRTYAEDRLKIEGGEEGARRRHAEICSPCSSGPRMKRRRATHTPG